MKKNQAKQAVDTNLVIAGEAGQGLATIGELLCKNLVRAGYEIVVSQGYHSRIRGGHNTFSIRISTEKIQAPVLPVDLLIALNTESVELHEEELQENGLMLADVEWEVDGARLLAVPYKDLSEDNKKYYNTVALGVVGAMLGLDLKGLRRDLQKALGKKESDLVKENLKILKNSHAWAKKNSSKDFRLPQPDGKSGTQLLLNGNEAIALGAMAAGVRFGAFYPMTPATSVMLNIIAHAEELGIVVEQAEDEIAALNMAIGASFGGAPSIVATSGGGFALMTEAVSLAGMTETPVVIVLAQRPAPATGLPTRTEQGDLDFVLHGGHGEFAKLIFAPGSIESCFTLTRKAFHLTEKYQTPCFILTDQYMADSYRSADPALFEEYNPVKSGVPPGSVGKPYKRYLLTEDGISPRLLPGASDHLVVADSDEHDEEGHITEDLGLRIRMVDKRLKKLAGLRSESLAPAHDGPDDPELLLVCWGSSMGPVLEAAELLRTAGKTVATLCFEQVWPLKPEQFAGYLEKAGRVVCVEGNATGQFGGLLLRETGLSVDGKVLRYDGLPFTPEYIVEKIEAM